MINQFEMELNQFNLYYHFKLNLITIKCVKAKTILWNYFANGN